MAESAQAAADGPAWRAGLAHKHRLLRGAAGHPALTTRAARFAARARAGGTATTFAELAEVPVWRLDPGCDRDRLAEIAGLLAARPVLLRTIAGPLLRDLAAHHTPALLEAVLEADLPDIAIAGGPLSLAPADLRRTGRAVLDAADDPAARAVADMALLLQAAEGRDAR